MKYLNAAQRVIDEEIKALEVLKGRIPEDFDKIVDYISALKSRIILTGMGKSGYIARKIAASFASTGTAAFYIHPAEASHGDLGMITEQDLVIMLSKSGETAELYDIINYCKRFAIKIAGMTTNKDSTLGKNSDFLLLMPNLPEASLIAAPTTSSLIMLALGDALTTTVQEVKGFNKDDFFIFHPGGRIGATLIKVKDLMKVGADLPLVHEDTKFTDAIIIITQKKLGSAIVVDRNMHLQGIITDGDLRRHINDEMKLKCARDTMTPSPIHIGSENLVTEALCTMNQKSITILPVVQDKVVIGAIHIHDIIRSGSR
jgi:arabinose-5-phosphate isomerase